MFSIVVTPFYLPTSSVQTRNCVLLDFEFLLLRTVPVIWGWGVFKKCPGHESKSKRLHGFTEVPVGSRE